MKFLLLNILIPVVLALATNGLIFALGWTQPDHDLQPRWAPPGYVVGMVWTILFALMGAARAITSPERRPLVTALIALCLAYPFYTLGFQDRQANLTGIIVTEAYTLYVTARLIRPKCKAALLLLPLIAWLCFAMALVMAVSRLND
jgi:tryptophan-rich sensory protein